MHSDNLVSMIIVNFNAGDLLRRCLDTVAAQTHPQWEVIIVDNASHDQSLETVQEMARVQIVHNSTNTGFAAAQNQGMRLARGRFLMPLNYDIEMTPRFLEEMVKTMQLSPRTGIVTGKLLRMQSDGTRLDTFYATGHVMPFNRHALLRGAGEQDRGQYDDMCQVFGAPGAAPLYRREMLQDIAYRDQYFDESLFTWYEDVDLDWRAKKFDWACIYAPSAVAYHIGHPAGHTASRWELAIKIRNRWLVVLANDIFWPWRKNTWSIAFYEFNLVRYVLQHGHLPAYLSALRQFSTLIPTALAKRRWMSQRLRTRHAMP